MQSSVSKDERARESISRVYSSVGAPMGGAELAGYGEDELSSLPQGVAEDSYGCGNPLSYARVLPGQTVLDLGSGAGLDLVLASQRVGPEGRVLGVDMTDAMIERARKNVARAGAANVEVRKGFIEALPVEDASVDWVISNCVISLSTDKARTFREIARVLRPGGQLLLSDIVVDEKLAWLLAGLRGLVPSVGYARTEADYLGAMRAAGLVDVQVRGRLVYEPEQLLVLFGGDLREAASCPITDLAARAGNSWLGRRLLLAAARGARGRVASVKLEARRA